jgi:hypothetical protein
MVALYKYSHFIQHIDNAAFDQINQPGIAAPWAGIYRCEGCGHEIAIAHNHILPAQNHPQHTQQQGAIRWRLTVGHS